MIYQKLWQLFTSLNLDIDMCKTFSLNEVIDAIRSSIDWRIERYSKRADEAKTQNNRDELIHQANLLNQVKEEILDELGLL